MNHKLKWLFRSLRSRTVVVTIGLLACVNMIYFLQDEPCVVVRHPAYPDNSASSNNAFGYLLKLVGYKGLTGQEVQTLVTSTPKIEPFKFVINSPVCKDSHVHALAIVITKPSNVEERRVVRETWGSTFKGDTKLRLLFLVGLADETVNKQVLEEHEKHFDILQANFTDSYKNLTLKTVAMLQWVKQHCPQTNYLIKIDDDVFLQWDNLQSRLSTLRSERRFILGHTKENSVPIRDPSSKWYSSLADYPYDRFPVYTSGPTYVISGDLISDLHDVARHVTMAMEDVFVTGVCAYLVRASHVGKCGFDRSARSLLGVWGRTSLITVHQVDPVLMRKMWGLLAPTTR